MQTFMFSFDGENYSIEVDTPKKQTYVLHYRK